MPRHGESIWKRKDGRWEARYIKYRDPYGKAFYASVYAKSYKEAKRKRDAALAAVNQRYSELLKADLTVQRVIDEFLCTRKAEVKKSTFTRYTEIAEWYIYPRIGSKSIKTLCQEDIDQFTFELITNGKKDGKGLAAKTTRDILAVFRQAIKYAVEKKYISNPDYIVKVPRQPKHSIQVFSRKEQEKLEVTTQTRDDPLRYGIYLCLYTGLRIGELCALRWTDIDLDNAILSINQTVQRIRNYDTDSNHKTQLLIDKPKTESSERKIPLPETINRQLMLLKQNCSAPNASYFLTSTSRIMEPRNYYEKYKKYLVECNLEGYNFHALRHTFATRCIEKGVDPKALSEILGHASVQITLDRYVHPSMDAKRSCLEKLISS